MSKQRIQDAWGRSQRVFRTLLFVIVLISLAYVVYFKIPHIDAASPVFSENFYNKWLLIIHAVAGCPPVFIGVLAFDKEQRKKSPHIHRWIGIAYCVCIWISAPTGVALATANRGGIVPQLGFGILGVLWFITTTEAFRHAKARNFVKHRRWMVRSFALSLAAVSVRPMTMFPPPWIDYSVWQPILSWLCWVPNIIVAEIYVRTTHFSGRLKLPKSMK